MMDPDVGERVRRAIRDAPAELSPLDAVREAMAAELAEVELRHEVWSLRAKVFQKSPHLLARGLGLHMAEERDLARTIARRIDPDGHGGPDVHGGPGGPCDDADIELYPRLLAAVAGTAARVAIEHWYAHSPPLTFPEIFRDVFTHLSAGLPQPPAQTDDRPSDGRTTES